MHQNQKGFVNIALVVLIIVIAGVAGYFAVVKKSPQQVSQPTPTPQNPPPTSQQPAPTQNDATASWKVYRNDKYGFEIKYPPDFKIDIKESTTEEVEKRGYKLLLNLIIEDQKTRVAKAESISGLEYFRMDIWKNEGSYDFLFQGPFPRKTEPTEVSGSQQIIKRSINNFDGVERYGYVAEGHSYGDEFYFKNNFVWNVSLNPVIEGRITLAEWQRIVPPEWPKEIRNNLYNSQTYKEILSSFRLIR